MTWFCKTSFRKNQILLQFHAQFYVTDIQAIPKPNFIINSSPPSDAYMRQRVGSALVQIMACCLFGTKPLPAQILAYCQLDSWEQITVKFESEFYFHSRKFIRKFHLPKRRPFYPGTTFIKPDQRNPWIKDQLWNDLLSTILHLQLPNFVSCGRDKPSHMTQNLVTVGVKL